MSNKNKTVSFRISEEKFEQLRSIADDRELSLSAVFRDYVDEFIAHDGHVELAPEQGVRDEATDASEAFPQTVEVPKSFVREHERIELECEHLRDQLDEYKRYVTELERELENHEAMEEQLVRLEEVDVESGTSLMID